MGLAANSTVEPGMIVLIDNEEIFCKAVSGDECTNAVRGYGGTTATTHISGASWVGSVHVQYHATPVSGNGSASIDYLNLNYYPGLTSVNNDNHNVFSGLTVSAVPLSYSHDRVFDQIQIDVAEGIGSQGPPPAPVQVGEYTDENNVTSSYGILATASCTVP